MMARTDYRVLSLAERGLLYSLRLECWVNQTLPESPDVLARVLGLDHAEVAKALPAVMRFFRGIDGLITCPELEDYRTHLEGIRERQSAGGRRGAEKTNEARAPKRTEVLSGNPSSNPSSSPSSHPSGNFRVLSSVQPSPAQPRGRGFSGEVYREVDGWGDFTTGPEQEVER